MKQGTIVSEINEKLLYYCVGLVDYSVCCL